MIDPTKPTWQEILTGCANPEGRVFILQQRDAIERLIEEESRKDPPSPRLEEARAFVRILNAALAQTRKDAT